MPVRSACFSSGKRFTLLMGLITFFNIVPVTAQVTPTVTTLGDPLSYVSVGQGVIVDQGLTISGTAITQVIGATVTIGNIQAGDELTFTSGGGITGNFVGNVLTLTGTATAADYQAVLRSVSFKAGGGGNPNTALRTITFLINISATNLVGL